MKKIYVIQISTNKFTAYIEKEDYENKTYLDNLSPLDSIDRVQDHPINHAKCLRLADDMGMTFQEKKASLPPYFFKGANFEEICDTFKYQTLFKLGLEKAEMIFLDGSIPKSKFVVAG